MNEHLETLGAVQNLALDLTLRFGPKIAVATIIMVGGFFAGRWVGRAMEGALSKFDLEPPVRMLLVRMVRVLVLGLFAIMALQNLGVELLPLIAGIGVAGAGIALAMQGVLGNLVAGLTIIFTRPFRIGEYVSMLGEEGEVQSITLFNTVLGHHDLSRVVIPNRKIVGEILHNYGRIRQLNVVVGVAYDTDLNAALAAIDDVLKSNPGVLAEPAPLIQVSVLADSSINIAVKPWVDVPVEAFRAREISIPFPQREVRLLGGVA